MSRADMVGLILAFLLLLIILMVGLYDMVYGKKKTKTKVKKEVTILLQQAKVASVLWGFLLVG